MQDSRSYAGNLGLGFDSSDALIEGLEEAA
jgi:hypothetical protein